MVAEFGFTFAYSKNTFGKSFYKVLRTVLFMFSIANDIAMLFYKYYCCCYNTFIVLLMTEIVMLTFNVHSDALSVMSQ